MPGCAAVGCNNRSEKGYIMKCFPRDPKLRKIWQERVARADWKPSNNSFLCHVHFEPEEWSILPNGRIRLKKNAIPSIFTVTSTRKSPKKRGKLASFKNQNQCDDYTMEYLENDTEHSSIGYLEEKDSDSQDIDDSSIKFVYQQINSSMKTTENKQVIHRQYKNVTSDLQESIILISDDNIEIEDNIKEGNNEKQTNTENKRSSNNCIVNENLTSNQNDIVVKTEIKQEHDQISLDSYDEIEEKLKQICDGGREESISNNVERLNATSNNQGVLEKSMTQIPILHRSINYKYSSRDEIGSLLTDDTENIEIIFGSESGEESARVPQCISYDNNETTEFNKTDQSAANIVNPTDDQEINKNFPEAIEKAFQGENIHVTPNMRAAIKRKRRTREEIMKSLKKSIRNASSRDTNSVSDSDISDNVEAENEIAKELNTSENVRLKDDTVPAITKFTVKVSGDREDIFDIMQDLSKDTKDFTIQECNDTYIHQGNNTFVTSIITIDDSPMEAFVKDEHSDDITPTSITSRGHDQDSFNLSLLKSNEYSSARLMSPHFDEENDLHINSNSILDVNREQPMANCTTKYECRKLRQKVKAQEDVIKRLSNQFILYQNSEKNLQNKNSALEIKTKKMENMMYEFNSKTDNTASSIIYKKNMDLKQKLIDDLTNRVNYLEEVNKKLMKTVTVESQYKRKLEGQIKQRDTRIKELNWKLEKASKFLDRAEKNTNTYRRKMLNMQTFMRRKKLLDEKMSRFNEMLIDNVKDGYTEKAIALAMEIKEICGSSGYNKLLNFGFPLPSLSVLRTPRDNSDSNESINPAPRAGPSKHNINEETGIQCTNDDVEANTKNQILESVCEEIDVTDNMEETIMGTVQDIFEENNDVDDFSTNELREHFILQLNAVM
ncbi:MATH and LRR domain-containing protein PFE0570w-like [Cataglyphis hispanica]|uniref:MATH and LRR domain-containing protein PFE0570w-like n=1 Tax=Cataglyphis hispanica TaxID=1086592 RepID=UPI002180890F|nr:MATH and LRR domain-containing protein PFE0570w-like [Cataglyphis hispanica]XP_050449407.1 MATH and LRR domain-containing protein PFE0570w-like [Cataglyphis hispanica]XP_050449408.1 MATH and LRR domain-containing protein PFE0570w-like [Cataglyphis hispanica]XP_050449409.1 MATH and LRR domain-containing protein PFE0570w-like [Cataglyphis hispanica]XP_050449410.1 MATH and LRR domain-containing protein PFE0570w-like [Cataglyphis hispanica]